MTKTITGLLLGFCVCTAAQAKELVRRVEIDQVGSSSTLKISAAFYDKFLDYDMNATSATCAVRLYNSRNGEATSIGLAYLTSTSESTPKGWFSVNVVDEKGRTAKVQSYVQPTASGSTQIDSVCWE